MGISSHSQLLSLSQETYQTLKTIIMNAFAFIILSLAAIATAAPGGWRCGRSPGWCKNKSSGGASSRGVRNHHEWNLVWISMGPSLPITHVPASQHPFLPMPWVQQDHFRYAWPVKGRRV